MSKNLKWWIEADSDERLKAWQDAEARSAEMEVQLDLANQMTKRLVGLSEAKANVLDLIEIQLDASCIGEHSKDATEAGVYSFWRDLHILVSIIDCETEGWQKL